MRTILKYALLASAGVALAPEASAARPSERFAATGDCVPDSLAIYSGFS